MATSAADRRRIKAEYNKALVFVYSRLCLAPAFRAALLAEAEKKKLNPVYVKTILDSRQVIYSGLTRDTLEAYVKLIHEPPHITVW